MNPPINFQKLLNLRNRCGRGRPNQARRASMAYREAVEAEAVKAEISGDAVRRLLVEWVKEREARADEKARAAGKEIELYLDRLATADTFDAFLRCLRRINWGAWPDASRWPSIGGDYSIVQTERGLHINSSVVPPGFRRRVFDW